LPAQAAFLDNRDQLHADASMEAGRQAFLAFVTPHLRGLCAVARQYLGATGGTEDLVQETLLRAWRSFTAADGRTYSRGWLMVILRNIVAEWRRTGRRRVRLEPVAVTELTEIAAGDLTEPLAPLPAMSEEAFREFLDDHVVRALDRLEPLFKEVLLLSIAGDLTYREIAEVLHCPVGTVMSRMARARRALREQLSAYAAERGYVGKDGRIP